MLISNIVNKLTTCMFPTSQIISLDILQIVAELTTIIRIEPWACVCVCVCMYVNIYIYICIYVYICVCVWPFYLFPPKLCLQVYLERA